MYKINQLANGYWSCVKGVNDTTPDATHRDFSVWEQSTSRVMYYFASSVGDQLLNYIQDAKTPKDVWANLKRIFVAHTMARKPQLRQEFSNVW